MKLQTQVDKFQKEFEATRNRGTDTSNVSQFLEKLNNAEQELGLNFEKRDIGDQKGTSQNQISRPILASNDAETSHLVLTEIFNSMSLLGTNINHNFLGNHLSDAYLAKIEQEFTQTLQETQLNTVKRVINRLKSSMKFKDKEVQTDMEKVILINEEEYEKLKAGFEKATSQITSLETLNMNLHKASQDMNDNFRKVKDKLFKAQAELEKAETTNKDVSQSLRDENQRLLHQVELAKHEKATIERKYSELNFDFEDTKVRVKHLETFVNNPDALIDKVKTMMEKNPSLARSITEKLNLIPASAGETDLKRQPDVQTFKEGVDAKLNSPLIKPSPGVSSKGDKSRRNDSFISEQDSYFEKDSRLDSMDNNSQNDFDLKKNSLIQDISEKSGDYEDNSFDNTKRTNYQKSAFSGKKASGNDKNKQDEEESKKAKLVLLKDKFKSIESESAKIDTDRSGEADDISGLPHNDHKATVGRSKFDNTLGANGLRVRTNFKSQDDSLSANNISKVKNMRHTITAQKNLTNALEAINAQNESAHSSPKRRYFSGMDDFQSFKKMVTQTLDFKMPHTEKCGPDCIHLRRLQSQEGNRSKVPKGKYTLKQTKYDF